VSDGKRETRIGSKETRRKRTEEVEFESDCLRRHQKNQVGKNSNQNLLASVSKSNANACVSLINQYDKTLFGRSQIISLFPFEV
jgi:hypothetical protein